MGAGSAIIPGLSIVFACGMIHDGLIYVARALDGVSREIRRKPLIQFKGPGWTEKGDRHE